MAPLFVQDETAETPARTFRDEMVDYIKRHFGDMLGADAVLLDEPGGVDVLATRLRARLAARRRRPAA